MMSTCDVLVRACKTKLLCSMVAFIHVFLGTEHAWFDFIVQHARIEVAHQSFIVSQVSYWLSDYLDSVPSPYAQFRGGVLRFEELLLR